MHCSSGRMNQLKYLGNCLGTKKEEKEVPLLCWGGSRPRADLDAVLDNDVKAYGKVRVNHLIEKPANEIYPGWSDEDKDEQLDNLIQDILNKCPIEHSWDVVDNEKKKKRKIQAGDRNEDLGKNKSRDAIGKKVSSCGETSMNKKRKPAGKKSTKQSISRRESLANMNI